MERESFENIETAEFMNKNFVSIKLDREERPDVDNLYMAACVEMTGQGGWPLSIFLTHDKKPFYAGTYFPAEDKYGMPGFISILSAITNAWRNERSILLESADSFIKQLSETSKIDENLSISEECIDDALNYFTHTFDYNYGGFGHAPKFPSPHNLMFLMRMDLKENYVVIKNIVITTLRGIANGGIRDHVAGGFCRYSTDKTWLTPHFEKMLYDNALLTIAYTEAIQSYCFNSDTSNNINGNYWNMVIRETLEYLTRDMLSSEGGFFTAEDADSEGEEGKFYVWTPEEIDKILGRPNGERFCNLLDITQKGNFEGKNIPNLIGKRVTQEDTLFIKQCVPKVLEARMTRISPFKDDKILLSSNGLIIVALSKAGHVLQCTEYIDKARNTIDFILRKMVRNGRLCSTYRDGKSAHLATLDGYAYFIWGLTELYEATFEPRLLKQAVHWNKEMLSIFMEGHTLYFSGSDVEDIPIRQQNASDGAVPAGQAIAVLNLIRLARMTGDFTLEDTARRIIIGLSDEILHSPVAYTGLLMSEMYLRTGGFDIVLVSGEGIEAMIEVTRGFYPFCTFLVCGERYDDVAELAPFTNEMLQIDGKATAYVCSHGSCMPPVTSKEDLQKIINGPR
jgi:uncharacterized protein YyaL (SSP411 family)